MTLDSRTHHPQTNSEKERNWSSLINEPTLLHIRCPDCFKLFSVRSADIRESRPKFKCTGCTQRFWIAYPEALDEPAGVIGFPLEWIENKAQTEAAVESAKTPPAQTPSPALGERPYSCPKCTEPYAAVDSECTKCGLIFTKYQDREKQDFLNRQPQAAKPIPVERFEPQTSEHKEVKDQWENTIQHFEDFAVHQKFIYTCQKFDSLDYARARYSELAQMCPLDENIQGALKQCLAIDGVRRELQIVEDRENSKALPKNQFIAEIKSNENVAFFTQAAVNFLKKIFGIRISTVLIIASGFLIALGFSLPGMRNLVGIGCSIAFLALAIRFLNKPA